MRAYKLTHEESQPEQLAALTIYKSYITLWIKESQLITTCKVLDTKKPFPCPFLLVLNNLKK